MVIPSLRPDQSRIRNTEHIAIVRLTVHAQSNGRNWSGGSHRRETVSSVGRKHRSEAALLHLPPDSEGMDTCVAWSWSLQVGGILQSMPVKQRTERVRVQGAVQAAAAARDAARAAAARVSAAAPEAGSSDSSDASEPAVSPVSGQAQLREGTDTKSRPGRTAKRGRRGGSRIATVSSRDGQAPPVDDCDSVSVGSRVSEIEAQHWLGGGGAGDEVGDGAGVHLGRRVGEKHDGEVDWGSMTVLALRDALRARGLKVSGNKAELVERLSGR